MPRGRIKPPEELDEVPVRLRAVGRPKNEDDPRLPMQQGAISGGKATPMRAQERDAADTFSVYCRNLVAQKGNIEAALAATLNLPLDVVRENLVELHDKIRAGARSGVSVSELLERHDMTRETRFVILREMLFSDTPAVRLKAIELLEEADMTAKASRMGGTWESIMRAAKERAASKRG